MKKSFFKKKFLTFIGCFMALLFTACGSVGVQQSGVSTNSSVEPHVHTTQYTKGWEATCTKVGVLDYWYCSGCKTYFSDAECKNPISQSGMVLGKAPHTPVLHERKEPIGDIDGNIEYYTCEVCKNYYADKECTMKITEGQTLLCSPWKLCDSIIEVEEGRDIVVLQLSDTQIIDAAQKRYPERLPAESDAYWATDKIEDRCYRYMRETIQATNPDLILLAGDNVYGEFDDKGTSFESFIEFMESFEIPWAPVFGNHDNESKKGVDWQCEQLENAEHCLFKRGDVTGNGNYTVGVVQGNELKRAFVMLDTHGCLRDEGLVADQVDWFREEVQKINNGAPDANISFVMHIPPAIFKNAYAKYGFSEYATTSLPINIDEMSNKAETDFGYLGKNWNAQWDGNHSVWNVIKALGVDSIFVGHEHANSASVIYDGVRLQFGQKSSAYDGLNYVTNEGKIIFSYSEEGLPMVGGSVFSISEANGDIINPYIYLCDVE